MLHYVQWVRVEERQTEISKYGIVFEVLAKIKWRQLCMEPQQQRLHSSVIIEIFYKCREITISEDKNHHSPNKPLVSG